MYRSLAAAALLLLAPAATFAQAPAGRQMSAADIPGLSPAGREALRKISTQQDPAVPKQLAAEEDLRKQMQVLLSGPTLDLTKLSALMAQARVVRSNGAKIIDEHLLTMLRALPPADRPVLLRVAAGATQRPTTGR